MQQRGLQYRLFPFPKARIMSRPLGQIKMNKTLSTSIVYRKNIQPQWISDNQLNYMSQYDFISYDLEQDNFTLVQKPFPHNVLAVRFLSLIGHRNLRVIYLYKDILSEVFYFMILPSLSFSDDYSMKRVDVPLRRVYWIQNFLYFSQGQFVIFPALFDDGATGIVYMALLTQKYVVLQIQVQNSNFCENSKLQEQLANKRDDVPRLLQKFKKSCIIQTKQANDIVYIYGNEMHLINYNFQQSQLKLTQKLALPYPQQTPSIPSHRCSSLYLSKLYIIIAHGTILYLYTIQNDKITLSYHIDCRQNGIFQDINCISGNLNSNKIVVSFVDTCLLAQYCVDDIKDTLHFINRIQFQIQGGGNVSRVVVSETGRNLAVFQLGQPEGEKYKHQSERMRLEEVINYSIFKIQLFTQLGIPDCSLCIKQPKFKTRSKRVNRLVIPKIYQKIFCLTGSEIHTLQSHKMSGVLFFDVHPFGFYMAVSYSFNIKIYSIQSASMTLLYSMTFQQLQQQLKKVLYSPDGSNLIVFSSRKLKVLDAFSFDLKYEVNQKNSIIVDAYFAFKRNTLLILCENGIITERSFYDFEKVKSYRVHNHNHRKFVNLKMDEKNQNIYILMEDGSIIIKYASILQSNQTCVSYQDNQKISQFFIESRNSLIFAGTKNGILRIHNIFNQKFSVKDYTQIYVSQSQITSITCSFLENCVYVGNIHGDITIIKYNPGTQGSYQAKSSKIIRSITPKILPSFSFDFELISTTKFQGNSQQNALQDKLENLIEKIQLHTANFKKSLISSYQETEKSYNMNEEQKIKAIYKEFDAKTKKIKNDRIHLKEKNHKNKKELTQSYEQKVKQVFKVQYQLQDEKQSIIKEWQIRRQREYERLENQCKQYQKNLMEQIDNFSMFYKKEEFIRSFNDYEDDFRISSSEMYKRINQSLQAQLSSLKQRCLQLNKNTSYLETARINILSRKVQEQTLQHRINTELRVLDEVRKNQGDKIKNLSKQLRLTQQMIHHIQNKVKNTPSNAISSDKADSDLCSYKIWMKNKVQQQLTKLQEYLNKLNENFQKKSQQVVIVTDQIRIMDQKRIKVTQKQQKLKQQLKNLRYKLVMIINNNVNVEKSLDLRIQDRHSKKHSKCQFDQGKAKKISAFQKLNEKALFFENKNLKIHTRKVKNLNTNNAQLLHQYEKLKYENKLLLDKQKQYERELINIKEGISLNEKKSSYRGAQSERTSLHKEKGTPFLTYIRHRASKTKRSLNCRSTVTTTFNSQTGMRSARTSRIL